MWFQKVKLKYASSIYLCLNWMIGFQGCHGYVYVHHNLGSLCYLILTIR